MRRRSSQSRVKDVPELPAEGADPVSGVVEQARGGRLPAPCGHCGEGSTADGTAEDFEVILPDGRKRFYALCRICLEVELDAWLNAAGRQR